MKNLLVCLLAVLTISVVVVSALDVEIDSVELNNMPVKANDGVIVAGFSGDRLPIRVFFTSNEDVGDARVVTWIGGYRDEIKDSSERIHLLKGSSYNMALSLRLPEDIDLSEEYTLYVRVEDKRDYVESKYTIRMQRESYKAEVLEVESANSVKAGEGLPITIVVKNVGYEELEDVVVEAKVLGTDVSVKAYLNDLPSVDSDNEEDSVEKVITLNMPSTMASGTYTIEVKVSNKDFEEIASKAITVLGAEKTTRVVVAEKNKETKVREQAEWTVTLVNTGKESKIYEFVPETSESLVVETDSAMLVVPAGESKSFKVKATSDKVGVYNFAVRIVSDGKVVGKAMLSAKVKTGFFDTETTIAVILAIIFAILLIVLIVLLTKKPKKPEEFEENYY
ncbi:MAG: hypothetical protein QXF25_01615 [Candidatus Pacearchaeota archaeon]